MSLLTTSRPTQNFADAAPVIEISDVAVRYRAAQERIPSVKEYFIHWLRREIRYVDFWALQDLSISIKPGEVLGIIGPNGAGKSTLLKVVARVLRPTCGRVRVRGRISPLLELGAGFDPELTGRENIFLNSAILGFSKNDLRSRFARIVAFARLHDFIDAPVRTYSTGMAARLGFAVATDVRPEILIVDEILGVGDAEFRTKSFERIQSFQAAGSTILLVSHDLEQVQKMCSRVLWLDHGKTMSFGDSEAIVAHYLEQVSQAEQTAISQDQANANANASTRWGSRRIEITGVRLTDQDQNPRSIFNTGDPLQIHMDYVAHEAVDSPIFGVAIHHNDGVHITGPNTRFAGHKLPIVRGSGTITLEIPCLTWLDGKYFVSVAVTDWADTEIFDYHNRLYPFRIDNRGTNMHERYGLMTAGGEWRFSGADFSADPHRSEA